MTEIINQIDVLIRAGKLGQARRLLSPFLQNKVQRQFLLPLSSLARRANLPLIAIRLLNPVVRPNRKVVSQATSREFSEYAASLIKIGSIDEALRILDKVDANEAPDSNLFSAFGYIAHWQYREAIPKLERYIQSKSLNEYQRLIGRVNLFASLVHERDKTVEPFGGALLNDTRESKAHLLYANTLELFSQFYILKKHFNQAEKFLLEAEKLIDAVETLDAFFIQKWKAIKNVYQNPKSKAAHKGLDLIIHSARIREHYETIRDCERHRSLATADVKLAEYLYFGTPNERFREELLRDFPGKLNLRLAYLKKSQEQKNETVLDLTNSRHFVAEEGRLLFRTLHLLLSDFYRPLRLATLYSQLYPGEFYNPVSSPNRIHQILKRLRMAIKKQNLPFKIREIKGSYQAATSKPVALLLPAKKLSENAIAPRLETLRRTFLEREFSIQEAMKVSSLSQRSLSRMFFESAKSGILRKTGKTAKARYKFIA